MTPAQPQTIKQSLNKAYRLIKPKRASMEAFKVNLVHLLNQIDEKESEENVKIHLMDFLKNTFYHPDYLVATKGKTDLVNLEAIPVEYKPKSHKLLNNDTKVNRNNLLFTLFALIPDLKKSCKKLDTARLSTITLFIK